MREKFWGIKQRNKHWWKSRFYLAKAKYRIHLKVYFDVLRSFVIIFWYDICQARQGMNPEVFELFPGKMPPKNIRLGCLYHKKMILSDSLKFLMSFFSKFPSFFRKCIWWIKKYGEQRQMIDISGVNRIRHFISHMLLLFSTNSAIKLEIKFGKLVITHE